MKIAYADPPYIGCAGLYKDHPDYAGEVNYAELLYRLETEYDGFILHASSPTIGTILSLLKTVGCEKYRVMAWVKPFAAFKRNVSVAYAWEPVIIKAARKPVVRQRIVMRDWIAESITLKKGLTGAKPVKVVRWALEMVGADPLDTLDDLYPGTGIVEATWKDWRNEYLEVKA